tara:strand:- start:689 stop:1213 length:525 start_codon:yes stop_codon:yes gene_type:complete
MICSQIYSRGEAVPYDADSIKHMVPGTSVKAVRRIIEQLIKKKKITLIPSNSGVEVSQLLVNRCVRELERSSSRMTTLQHNGNKGARPSKENNDLAKPDGFPVGLQDEKPKSALAREPSTINHQPSTINEQETGGGKVKDKGDKETLEIPAFLDRRPARKSDTSDVKKSIDENI